MLWASFFMFGNLDFHGGLASRFKEGKLGSPRFFRVGVNTIIANTAAAAWLLGPAHFPPSKQRDTHDKRRNPCQYGPARPWNTTW